jgi:hypothetical protein
MRRREFLTAACGSTLLMARARRAEAKYGFRFTADDEFSGNWRPWLKDVVGMAMLMIEPPILANYRRLHTIGFSHADGVWERSNNAYNSIAAWRSPARLMEYQLLSLQGGSFQPPLHIRWGFEEGAAWWGRANLGTVALIYDPDSDGVKLEGEFEIQLNAYWATTRDARHTLPVWGGVVAHEMLHNLGHGHGVNEYDDRWPINILDRCVTHQGRYRGGYRQYRWLCGGRLPS